MKTREFLIRFLIYLVVNVVSMVILYSMNIADANMPMAVLGVTMIEFLAVFLFKLPKTDEG